jgi:hypothetical protein
MRGAGSRSQTHATLFRDGGHRRELGRSPMAGSAAAFSPGRSLARQAWMILLSCAQVPKGAELCVAVQRMIRSRNSSSTGTTCTCSAIISRTGGLRRSPFAAFSSPGSGEPSVYGSPHAHGGASRRIRLRWHATPDTTGVRRTNTFPGAPRKGAIGP